MPLQPAQIYQDIFHRDPPTTWTEGTAEERQLAVDAFSAEASKVEVSETDFDAFLGRIREQRESDTYRSSEEADAA